MVDIHTIYNIAVNDCNLLKIILNYDEYNESINTWITSYHCKALLCTANKNIRFRL